MKEAINATELAALLDVHPASLAKHLPELYRQRLPKPRKIGRCRRWSRQAVLDWLAGGVQRRADLEDAEIGEVIRGL